MPFLVYCLHANTGCQEQRSYPHHTSESRCTAILACSVLDWHDDGCSSRGLDSIA